MTDDFIFTLTIARISANSRLLKRHQAVLFTHKTSVLSAYISTRDTSRMRESNSSSLVTNLDGSASLHPQEVKEINPQLPHRATSPSHSFLSKVGLSRERFHETTRQKSIDSIIVPAPR